MSGYGISDCSFSVKNIILAGNYNGIIKIQGIEGNLITSDNSKFGSLFRIIIWAPKDYQDPKTGEYVEDENISKEKILWEGSIRIENGKVYTSGSFSLDDFDIVYEDKTITVNSNNEQQIVRVAKVVPKQKMKNGFSLNLLSDIKDQLLNDNPRNVPFDVINSISVQDLAVSIEGDAGYGYYMDIYDDKNKSGYIANDFNNINETIINNVFSAEPTLTNYPQPFSNSTFINFKLPATSLTTLEVYNIQGQKVQSLFNEIAIKDEDYLFEFTKENLPAGLYICRLQSGSYILTRKLIIKD